MAEGCPATREIVEALRDPSRCHLCGEPAAIHRWEAANGANEAATGASCPRCGHWSEWHHGDNCSGCERFGMLCHWLPATDVGAGSELGLPGGSGSAPAYTKQDAFFRVVGELRRLREALSAEHGVDDLPVRHEPPCAVCDLLWPGTTNEVQPGVNVADGVAKKGSGYS